MGRSSLQEFVVHYGFLPRLGRKGDRRAPGSVSLRRQCVNSKMSLSFGGKEKKSNYSMDLADTHTGPPHPARSPPLCLKAERVELIVQIVVFL